MPAWLPTKGLVRLHYEYGTYCTDAPPVFHVASILTTISAVCADTGLLMHRDAVHPLNIWTMIVGRSSVDRKTTAVRLAVDRLANVAAERILDIAGSPEGFLQGLKEEPCALLHVPEGAAFFEQTKANYWSHAKGLFMDLYDYKLLYRRRLARETLEIENPRLAILCACAAPLLDHYSKLVDWLGGFLPRFLMIMGDKTDDSVSLRGDPGRQSAIQDQIFNIFNHQWGQISCSLQAGTVLEQFNVEIMNDLGGCPENLHPALVRLPETALRLSALYEIAAHAAQPPQGTLQVSLDSAHCAVALCRESRDQALLRLAEMAESPAARELTRIETLIRLSGVPGMTRKQLVRRSKLRKRDLDQLIETLVDGELITVRKGATPQRGPAPSIYTHTSAQDDAVRSSRNQIIDPEPTAWIPVEGPGEAILNGLPWSDDDDDIDWN